MKRIILTTFFTLLCSTLLFATTESDTQDLGVKTYAIACKTCHGPSVAQGAGAPEVHDVSAWKQRIKNAKKALRQDKKRFNNAYTYLAYQVKIGKGLMHHGGLCLEANVEHKNCSDDAYIAAIKFMSQPAP